MKRTTTRTIVTTLLVLLATTPIVAQDSLTRRIEVGDARELRLVNVAGDISITGGGGNAIVTVATKRGGSQEARDRIDVEVAERGDRVGVRTRYRRNHRTRVSVDFEVQVPTGTEVSATSVSGSVTVERGEGETRAETVSGDVRVTGATDFTRAKSVSGDIVLADSSAERELHAETVSGSSRRMTSACGG